MKVRFEQLDGLKGLAIVIIIASHTAAFGMYGQGSIWADFFFVLGGFFCVIPLLKDGEEKFVGIKAFLSFYIKRIARIIFPYWICIIFFNWINGSLLKNKRDVIRSIFLIQTSGHIWYIQHLMVGYFFVPFLMLLIYILKKNIKVTNLVVALFLTVSSVFLCRYLFFASNLYLLWNEGNHRVVYSGLVILGMGIGYFYKSINSNIKKHTYIILDIFELLLILFLTVITSHSFIILLFGNKYDSYIFGWNHPDICGVLGGLLVLIAAINDKGMCVKVISNKLFVFIGNISLEVYLIHYYLLDYFTMEAIPKFCIIIIISISVGYMMNKYMDNYIYKNVKKILENNMIDKN